MTFALDSNTITYLLKKDSEMQKQLQAAVDHGDEYVVPPMVYYEIKRWLLVKNAAAQLAAFDKLCRYTGKVMMDDLAWEKAIEIYVNLNKNHLTVDDADILIAAFCMVNDCVLVTCNTRHFSLIDGLKFVDWKRQN